MTHDTDFPPAEIVSVRPDLERFTAQIVGAYVSNSAVPQADVPALIASVHAALAGLGAEPAATPIVHEPAVPVGESVFPDHLVSLIDGKSYRSLKRHLGTHGLTPAEYRERFGLRPDYPIVCSDYSAVRSTLAKRIGLGRPAAAKPALAAVA